jgi:hypothetical protein
MIIELEVTKKNGSKMDKKQMQGRRVRKAGQAQVKVKGTP